ncbi:aspartate/tyrosine/aromatic aminotransferase [Paracoccus suum]|uniref:Aminotransferase n=1 Tax=Paracoccus suum TaxID=2259340 RepID=A0A344PIC4_9RHOB|nr:amino acid aminotransferase [Paracoccus suum]AXC49129.1 aspartate/tyrosine/aromatic aminotransferase [Paracoccus suum]
MLGTLEPQNPDKILMLMAEFRGDTRQGKIDLGVGVYKDATGHTPIMRAVRAAEAQLLQTETTKTYTNLSGEPAFRDAMAAMVLGDALDPARTATLATVGGTGALRAGLELARMGNPDLTVWVPDPTWPNHLSIINFMGLKSRTYRYFDPATRAVDEEAMLADLAQAARGDLVLLHGCCHNPTGADPSPAAWPRIAEVLARSGAVPFVDLAYQGFGNGLDEDAAGARILASHLPEVIIAVSCSKNFGIYRERAGLLLAQTEGGAARDLAQGAMATIARATYSFPPDHGARIVSTILHDAALAADWREELEAVRLGMIALREQLASELRAASGSDRFDFIARHRGMFSRIGATPEQVERLKREAAIYIVGDSRLNIAGLNTATVPILARALVEVGV